MPTRFRLRPISQSEFLVTIAGVEGYWTECSGVKQKFEVATYSDGLSKSLKKIRGVAEIEDVELKKPFYVEADSPIVEMYRDYCDRETDLTVTIQPIVRCGEVIQYGDKKITLLGCRFMEFEGFQVDTTKNEVSMLMIKLSVDEFQWA